MPSISKKKTITILIIIIVSAFLGTSVFNYLSTSSSIRKEVFSSGNLLLSENVYSEIQRELSLPINISSAMSRDAFLINWVSNGEADPGQVVQYLRKVRDDYSFFSTFFVSDITKNYYYYDGILKEISPDNQHDEWYYTFINSGKEYDLDVDTDEAADNILTIFVNFRIEDFNNNLLGVVGVGIRLENVAEKLLAKQNQYNRTIYLVDASGVIQVHSEMSEVGVASVFEQEGLKEIAPILFSKHVEPVNGSYRDSRGKIIISSRYIPDMDWFIVIEQQSDIIFALARHNLFLTILVGVVTTFLLILLSSKTINSFQRHMEIIASTDPLTNVANRREFEHQFEKARYRFSRYNIPVSLVLIDIDNFKIINDQKGHLTGDKVLKVFSRVVSDLIRPDDFFARWGGDEFLLIIEAKKEEAFVLAERLRIIISDNAVSSEIGLDMPLSVSAGVTDYRGDEDVDQVMSRVDKALYKSKNEGKNRVTLI